MISLTRKNIKPARGNVATSRAARPLRKKTAVSDFSRRLTEANKTIRLQQQLIRNLQLSLKLAAATERQRLLQELHDNLCQQLLGIMFASRALTRELDRSDKVASQKLRELGDLLNEAVQTCNNLKDSAGS